MPAVPAWLVVLSILLAVGVIAWIVDFWRRGWPEYWFDMLRLRRHRARDQKRKGTKEQQKARLITAIQDYWQDDLKYADRESRRRFAKELADMIADNITSKRG